MDTLHASDTIGAGSAEFDLLCSYSFLGGPASRVTSHANTTHIRPQGLEQSVEGKAMHTNTIGNTAISIKQSEEHHGTCSTSLINMKVDQRLHTASVNITVMEVQSNRRIT